ncbi:MAG: hypothetical protein WEB13_09095 [Dehalococcoidia bacterium]|jgi:hypothetical protein
MTPTCTYCLYAVPLGWPEVEECAECRAIEAARSTLAYSVFLSGLPDRDTYLDWPEGSWRHIAGGARANG